MPSLPRRSGGPAGGGLPTSPGIVHSRRSSVLLILGYLAAQALLPWRALALIPLGWAAVESGRAMLAFTRTGPTARGPAASAAPAGSTTGRAAGRGGMPGQRSSVVWTLFGMFIIGLMITSVVLPFLFYRSSKDYQDCMLGANTGVATARCQQSYEGDFGRLLNGRSG